jgi:DNA-directed RNA polymerase specialized sigma24 family protein
VADARPDPETAFLTAERLAELEEQLGALAPDDRLLLRLRFEQGLTLAEAASVVGLSDYRRAHERLGRILDGLRAAMAARGWT